MKTYYQKTSKTPSVVRLQLLHRFRREPLRCPLWSCSVSSSPRPVPQRRNHHRVRVFRFFRFQKGESNIRKKWIKSFVNRFLQRKILERTLSHPKTQWLLFDSNGMGYMTFAQHHMANSVHQVHSWLLDKVQLMISSAELDQSSTSGWPFKWLLLPFTWAPEKYSYCMSCGWRVTPSISRCKLKGNLQRANLS